MGTRRLFRVQTWADYQSSKGAQPMNYWVCKGKPWNEFRTTLKPGAKSTWYTGRRPKSLSRGDVLFLWESSPARHLVGLGVVVKPDRGINKAGKQLYEQRYLTHRLRSPLRMEELRRIPIVREAIFLKAGPTMSLTSLTHRQAQILLQMIRSRNPLDFPKSLTVAQNLDSSLPSIADATTLVVTEGGRKLFVHYVIERDQRIANKKREAALVETGRLACEVCGFDFTERYGPLGNGFCEVHHRKMLSQIDGKTETGMDDLAILCSNCHRMIHKNGLMTVAALRKHLR